MIVLEVSGEQIRVETVRDADEIMEAELADARRRGYETRIHGNTYQIRDGKHKSWLTIARRWQA